MKRMRGYHKVSNHLSLEGNTSPLDVLIDNRMEFLTRKAPGQVPVTTSQSFTDEIRQFVFNRKKGMKNLQIFRGNIAIKRKRLYSPKCVYWKYFNGNGTQIGIRAHFSCEN
jgi:hypothetical protein